MISYDFKEGQIVRLFEGRPETAWAIYDAPDELLREVIIWNDGDADVDGLNRATLLEIFLSDFIGGKE